STLIRLAPLVFRNTYSRQLMDFLFSVLCWATRRLRMAVSVVAGMGVGYDRTTEVAGVVGRG
ncbi:MAG: hypothetical protein ACRDZ8_18780, partial [Acidimicrobiales bacterium]